MPQDPESHWATRGVIAWLRVPRWVKGLAVFGAVSLALNIALATSLFATRRIVPRVLQGSSSSACPVAGANEPGAADPWGGCFPGPGVTGVPDGTSLTAYADSPIVIDSSGDLTVLSDNVTIDSKIIGTQCVAPYTGCQPVHIRVAALNFTLSNSILYGIVTVVDGFTASYTLTNNKIDSTGDDAFKSITGDNLTVTGNDVSGSFSGGVCTNCVLEDNWFHDNWLPADSTAHMSGYRMDDHTTLNHNTFSCTSGLGLAGEAGCSAPLTGYPDWEPVANNTMHRNLFVANPDDFYFCAYGGATTGKPYSGLDHDVVFSENIFQKGSSGVCGAAGVVTDFDEARPGNTWSSNKWDDGTTIPTP